MNHTAIKNSELKRKIDRAAPTVLTCLSAVGMLLTIAFAVKATPKAIELMNEAALQKNEPLTKMEKLKAAAPAYISTTVIGAASLGCMFGANVLSRKQQALYISAYSFLEKSFKQYKDEVKELYGENADSRIKGKLSEEKIECLSFSDCDKVTFYEDYRGEFFELSKEELISAEYELNRLFILRGYVTLNDFYILLGLPTIDMGELLGWSAYIGEVDYGYSWVDFSHEKHVLDDGLEYYILDYPFAPTMDYESY